MKTLIVREGFGLDGKDYSRGDEITSPAVITKVLASHAGHVHATPYEAGKDDAPAPEAETHDGEQENTDLRAQ